MKYKITLSNKEVYVVGNDDYQKIKNNINQPFIQLEVGVINPAFIISMKEDPEAIREEIQNRQNEETLQIISRPVLMDLEEVKMYRPDFVKEALEAKKKSDSLSTLQTEQQSVNLLKRLKGIPDQ